MPVDEKSWVLRLSEVAGRRGKFCLEASPGWTAALSDIRGKAQGKATESLEIPYSPYQVLSVIFVRRDS
jgi:hypothetical protein